MVKFKSLYDRVKFHIKNEGMLSLLMVGIAKICDILFPPRLKFYDKVLNNLKEKKGLEIGGPSKVFSKMGLIPVYSIANQIDNLNFSNTTIWEGNIVDTSFKYKNKVLGKQFIREAIDLYGIEDSKYDFVLSSEMIQHLANPLKGLKEWIRVIKDNGYLVLIVPHKARTFDHLRKVTEFEHLIDDFRNDISEKDMTHLEEVLKYHDLSRDRPAGTFEQFKKRCENNYEVRAIHHHVFDEKLLIEMVNYTGLQILDIELILCNTVLFLQKLNSSTIDNSKFLNPKFDIRFSSTNFFQSFRFK